MGLDSLGFSPPAASVHQRLPSISSRLPGGEHRGHVGGESAHTDTELLLLSEQVSELHRGQCPVLPHLQGTLQGNKDLQLLSLEGPRCSDIQATD